MATTVPAQKSFSHPQACDTCPRAVKSLYLVCLADGNDYYVCYSCLKRVDARGNMANHS